MYKFLYYYKNNNGDLMIYLAIFLSKIIENSLATLRIIVVSNGKKKLGAILQGLVALVWILVTGVVIIDVNKDIFKIIAFCLGSITGSYFGSLLEEKIALGMVKITIDSIHYRSIYKILNNYNPSIKKNKITIILKRKDIKTIISIIQKIDKNATIVSERIKLYDK